MFSTKQNRNSQTVQNLTVITDKVSVLSSCFLNWYLLILIFSVVTLISSTAWLLAFLPHCLHRIWTTCSALSNTQLLMSRVKKLKSHSPCASCIYHIFLYLCTFKRIWRGFMRIHAFFFIQISFSILSHRVISHIHCISDSQMYMQMYKMTAPAVSSNKTTSCKVFFFS